MPKAPKTVTRAINRDSEAESQLEFLRELNEFERVPFHVACVAEPPACPRLCGLQSHCMGQM